MGDPAPHITAAELDIMKVLWRLGRGTVREVLTALEADRDEGPAYTTVMTLMKQLAEKGALRVDRTRQPYMYMPAVAREAVLRQRLAQFLHSVFDGQAGDLVLHLVKAGGLTAEELRRIEEMISAHEKGAGTRGSHGARRKRRTE
jgi:BlaI family penicillinase repressor